MPGLKKSRDDAPSYQKACNFTHANLLAAFSAVSLAGYFIANNGCYEDDLSCTTHIVNKLAKEQGAENLIEKAKVKKTLESGGQVFTFDTKSNVITVTTADVQKELEDKKTVAQPFGAAAAGGSALSLLLYAVAASPIIRRRKDEDGLEEAKGGQPGENNLG